MVVIEMKESSYNDIMDLAESAMKHVCKAKADICDLYDCLEESFDQEEPEDDKEESNYANIGDVEIGEINYRRGMRRSMKNSMRDMYDEDEDMRMKSNMRSGMRNSMRRRMRRSMTNRYSY